MAPDALDPASLRTDARDPFAGNRVILCHFDSYSTALLFARWPGKALLAPAPLPEGARPRATPPAEAGAAHDAGTLLQATVARYGLNPAEIVHVPDFDEWLDTPDGPLKVHLLRFTCFEAPHALLEPHDAVFKPISELRGSDPAELNLLRTVFNLIITGGGRA